MKLFIPLHITKNITGMETAVVTTRARRIKTFTKPKTARVLDAYFISLTKQIEAGLKPSLNFEEVEKALASGSVSPDVIDDLEDAMFGVIMTESSDNNNESVGMDEVFEVLRR